MWRVETANIDLVPEKDMESTSAKRKRDPQALLDDDVNGVAQPSSKFARKPDVEGNPVRVATFASVGRVGGVGNASDGDDDDKHDGAIKPVHHEPAEQRLGNADDQNPTKAIDDARDEIDESKDVKTDRNRVQKQSSQASRSEPSEEGHAKDPTASSPGDTSTGRGDPSKNEAGDDNDIDDGDSDKDVTYDDDEELDLAAMRNHEYEQVARFGPAQLRRYESYRRSDLKKEKIRRVLAAINPILGRTTDQFLIAIKGLAKVFVGDVVEASLEVRDECGDTGALQTKHLRGAYRRLRRNGAIPTTDVRHGGIAP